MMQTTSLHGGRFAGVNFVPEANGIDDRSLKNTPTLRLGSMPKLALDCDDAVVCMVGGEGLEPPTLSV